MFFGIIALSADELRALNGAIFVFLGLSETVAQQAQAETVQAGRRRPA